MTVEWSGLAPEVLLALDRGRGVPLRAQLEDQFRQAIRSGRVGAGDRVPSSRALARALGLSRGLVQECYAQLQAEGYLVTRGGSATRVATAATREGPATALPPAPRPRLAADFASGVPDLASVPREDWAWAIREACRTAPASDLGYGDPAGNPRLREVLAAYLRRARAADTTAGQVIICSGMAQSLGLVLRALAGQGLRKVGFEDPGSVTSITAAADWAGLQAVPVPVDDRGVDVAALDATGVLRLGWIASPPGLATALAGAKQVADRGSPGLDQLALALLIETGRYDRHLRRMRAEYAARRDVLLRALAAHAPSVRLTGLAAGFHAVAHLPTGAAEHEVIHAARTRSVGLYGMSTHRADRAPGPPQLILGFGNTSQTSIQTGITVLGDILSRPAEETAEFQHR